MNRFCLASFLLCDDDLEITSIISIISVLVLFVLFHSFNLIRSKMKCLCFHDELHMMLTEIAH